MQTSKGQADEAFRAYKGIIYDLLDTIFYLRQGLHDIPDLMQTAKDAIQKAKSFDYKDKIESLVKFYGLQPEYENLEVIAQQIEKGELDSPESELARILEHVKLYETKRP